jgi:ribonuclease HI
MIEVYFDGLCEPNPGGVATYGFVVRRGGRVVHDGHGLACPPRTPQCTNNVAEYTGLVKALEYLATQDVKEPVLVRGDSELVLRQLTGAYKVKSPLLAPLYERVRELSARLPSIRFEHVPRESNAEADRLTRLAFAEYAGRSLPPPTTDRMMVDLVFAAPRDRVAAALREAGLAAETEPVPGGTRVQCELPLQPEALRPLLALKRKLEGLE